ncbi:hypothetical protein [Candidatus Poriferisocius sp.]|uniref:hypothetical protein n=1 Tax=Candidatus Poriferisocius sp. TaxID=3101276 RepID=UPI003B594B66
MVNWERWYVPLLIAGIFLWIRLSNPEFLSTADYFISYGAMTFFAWPLLFPNWRITSLIDTTIKPLNRLVGKLDSIVKPQPLYKFGRVFFGITTCIIGFSVTTAVGVIHLSDVVALWSENEQADTLAESIGSNKAIMSLAALWTILQFNFFRRYFINWLAYKLSHPDEYLSSATHAIMALAFALISPMLLIVTYSSKIISDTFGYLMLLGVQVAVFLLFIPIERWLIGRRE